MRRVLFVIPLIFMGCSFGGGGSDKAAISSRGSVCGDPMIIGEPVGEVEGQGACGIADAVRVRAIGNITLSQSAVVECGTARALRGWVEGQMVPAIGRRGGGAEELHVVAHYACRTRNSKRGARLSEHASGRAIDIAGFGLRDGSEISVLDDWNRGRNGRILRDLHRSACGPFGTVLGPESDRHHRDHFHFDTASYRSGAYCR